jgi:penicillin-binding protein 2
MTTFKLRGTVGKDGLEKWFDAQLQGEPGGRIYRVDPAGYKINPPLAERKPKQGQHLVTSLDIDLQLAAEEAIGDNKGAAVAIDVMTGEVLVLASKPDFDLNKFSPRASKDMVADMNERGVWTNFALNGFYAPGSTFKILTSIAGMRRGVLTPNQPIVDCDGHLRVGNRSFSCYNGIGHHHNVLLPEAIAQSCDVYFYRAGELITADALAAEGRRFHLDQTTGIELPNELRRMVIPDPEWKERTQRERWFPGDTATMAIGQSFLLVTPLQMACFTASVARGETFTHPTLVHQPNRPQQHSEPIGLTAEQRAALLEGMEGVTTHGTAKLLTQTRGMGVPGIHLAGKTGTAQKDVYKDGKKLGKINLAWFICFAPVEKPEIAMAIMLEGEKIGEEFGGGRNSGPVASAILQKYFEKKNAPAKPARTLFKAE